MLKAWNFLRQADIFQFVEITISSYINSQNFPMQGLETDLI